MLRGETGFTTSYSHHFMALSHTVVPVTDLLTFSFGTISGPVSHRATHTITPIIKKFSSADRLKVMEGGLGFQALPFTARQLVATQM